MVALKFTLYKKGGGFVTANSPAPVASASHSHYATFECTTGGSVSINISPTEGEGNLNKIGDSI
jgi:hypothetical protein